MTTVVPWNPDLPQKFLRDSYSIQPVDNVLRETMDVGPPKSRPRSTVSIVRVTAAMHFTGAQRRTFLSYYRIVLRWGTIAFALDDPDGITQQYYMIAPPQLKPDGLGWRCDMQLQYTEA